MDYLRSAYTSYMVFRTGDPPVKVTWFRAKKGAALFPTPHNFYSSNWNHRDYHAGDIGEQEVIDPWIEPATLARGAVQNTCTIPPTWWLTGIPAGNQAPATDGAGVPLCCSAQAPCSCNGNILPDTMTGTWPDGTCTILHGVVVTLTRVAGTCAWTGNAPLFFGGSTRVFLTFRFAGPQADAASLEVTYFAFGSFTSTVLADSSSTCSPRTFKFLEVSSGGAFPCIPQRINIS